MRAEPYRQALAKGAKWLLEQQNADGSMNPVEGGIRTIYKVPAALSVAGHDDAAFRLLDWVRANFTAPGGDFVGSYPRPRTFQEVAYPYPNSWLVIGAHRLGRFDISFQGFNFMLSMQSRYTGAFYSRKDDTSSGKAKQVLWVSAMGGLAALYIGKLDRAQVVGAFLQRMYNTQPDIRHKMYLVYNIEDGLMTSFPRDEARIYLVQADKPDQLFFVPGLITVFLVRLAQATGRDDYVELGKNYTAFAQSCTEAMYSEPTVGKVGWGAALLYQMTGDEQYKALARRIAAYLVESQSPEGSWRVEGPEGPARTIDNTAEFVVILDEMIPALA